MTLCTKRSTLRQILERSKFKPKLNLNPDLDLKELAEWSWGRTHDGLEPDALTAQRMPETLLKAHTAYEPGPGPAAEP